MRNTLPKIFIAAIVSLTLLSSCDKNNIAPDQSDFFVKFYGNAGIDEGKDIKQTADGGYIITGSQENTVFGTTDLVLIKTDPFGNETWKRTFGDDSLNEVGNSVVINPSGGYFILGTAMRDMTQSDMWLLLTDDNGNVDSTKYYGASNSSEEGNSMIITSLNGYMLAGSKTPTATGNKNAFCYLLDINMVATDSLNRGTTDNDEFNDVVEMSNGDFAVIASSHLNSSDAFAGNSNIYPAILQPDLDLKTRSTNAALFPAGEDFGTCIDLTNSGEIIIAGYTNSTWGSTTTNNNDLIILKYSNTGLVNQWYQIYGGLGDDRALDVEVLDNGNIAITGTRTMADNGKDIYLLVLDANGNLLNENTFGGSEEETGNKIIQTDDGGYAIIGSSSFLGNQLIDLTKTNSDGNLEP